MNPRIATHGPPVAKRGAQLLDENDLRAHLATLLRVEHASVLLGSGASIGALGGRTMSDAWSAFKAASPDSLAWLVEEQMVEETSTPNLEELADVVEVCRLERERIGHPDLARASSAQADLRRALIRAASLRDEYWQQSMSVLDSPALASHRLLLQKLCGARQPGQPAPWVFTSNFDLAIEWAAESVGLACINGFSGLHSRRFSPHNFELGFRNVLAKGEARFGTYNFCLAKLHGSLNWEQANGEIVEQPAHVAWTQIEKFLAGESGADSSRVVALPGAGKFVSTTGFVLGELFRRLTDFVSQPQSMVIVNGYSCSDDHINRLLLTALQNPTLQLVVCAKAASIRDGVVTVPPGRPWIRKLAALDLPQVTIVCGDHAGFDRLVACLPDPALYDEQAAAIKKMLVEQSGRR